MADSVWLLGAELSCRRSAHPDWWISEDPVEREAAAHGCADCLFRDSCLELALSSVEPVTAGVWGGVDFTPVQEALFEEAS